MSWVYDKGLTPLSWRTEAKMKEPSKPPSVGGHLRVSFVKSSLRILAYGTLFHVAPGAAVILALAEVLGIFEELV